MRFKDNLRKKRTLANLSQEELADRMLVSRQTISKWENGDTYPSTEHIFMLTKILKCNINSLIDESGGEMTDSENGDAQNMAEILPRKNCMYWMAGAFLMLFLTIFSFGLLASIGPKTHDGLAINNSKASVFDKIIDGTLDNAVNVFSQDGFIETKIVGYGIANSDGSFYIKYNLTNRDSGMPCSAIIYFDEESGDYSFRCQYLDDPDYVPSGEYYKVG